MKIAGVMELVPKNGTWPVSMSFHARMVARLVAPLSFFYLGWIHENQDIGGNFENNLDGVPKFTAFSKFYQIQVVPVLGNSFSTFFPVLLLIISFLTMTNILNRILIFCKLEKYQFGQTFITNDALEDGKKQLSNKKKYILSKKNRANFTNIIKLANPLSVDEKTNNSNNSNKFEYKIIPNQFKNNNTNKSLEEIHINNNNTEKKSIFANIKTIKLPKIKKINLAQYDIFKSSNDKKYSKLDDIV
jgi:hypothetical protein